RRPSVLKNDVKVFFCKYNDPIYVKLAKLEIMYRLAREENAREVLAELQEYASEVDIDFVRRLAIKVQPAADSCIQALLDLIETKVTYVVQEAVIVIKDAAVIWIIGQFANRIDNADELMDDLTYTFLEEPTEVQLALLTAAVKLFIYKATSDTTKSLVHKVLKWATEEVDNPDLRDRGFMYWRMLAINPAVAGEIVLAEKPAITTDADRMDRGALDQLLLHTGTLGSIYHKNPETFIRNATGKALADSPALNSLSRQVLVPLARSHGLPNTVVVSGPGPAEPAKASNGELVATDTNGAAAHDGSAKPGPSASSTSLESPMIGNDDDEGVVSPPVSADPYAGLNNAFGGYVADEPRPQGQDLLDLI
ncbi:armadillo-type protein, partial [Epithele typhae]|uniref:armadillo-type protein n=1 Tax=Epithele typhae TaxID=378194 RepID=UPI002007CF92